MSDALTITACSRGGLNGIGDASEVTRRGADCKSLQHSSTTRVEISAPAPQVRRAGSTTTRRPVFRTDANTRSQSKGASVRGSMTSAEIPSSSSSSCATVMLSPTIEPRATMVRSGPLALDVTDAERDRIRLVDRALLPASTRSIR